MSVSRSTTDRRPSLLDLIHERSILGELLLFRPSNLALVTSSSGFPLRNIGLKVELLFVRLILSSLHLASFS